MASVFAVEIAVFLFVTSVAIAFVIAEAFADIALEFVKYKFDPSSISEVVRESINSDMLIFVGI